MATRPDNEAVWAVLLTLRATVRADLLRAGVLQEAWIGTAMLITFGACPAVQLCQLDVCHMQPSKSDPVASDCLSS
ncbi:hypothetical protein NDU88_004283 [Pleurodeles waltl]|uniref:Uncharacterized protein n=1 Tax=Pleurodeles waltl TaxID=8319 RepID=A0AAV7W7N9_PLEWA|nr:hypothetical protein NDU88_004283 [Pleurodeles waltl]